MTEPGVAVTGSGTRCNLELKGIDRDPMMTLRVALANGARDLGTISQRDTYFCANRGRLKLREEMPGRPHLIHYVRRDSHGPRQSAYRVIPVDDPAAICATLGDALGIRVVVEKKRRLLLIGNVRAHLDRVVGLGTYLELEAVVPAGGSPDDEHEKLGRLADALGLTHNRVVVQSYADYLESGLDGAIPMRSAA